MLIKAAPLFLLAASLLFSTSSVFASFECEKVWSGASKDNDVTDCFTDVDHLVSLVQDEVRIQYASGIVISLLLIIITLLCCPTVTICRYVCRCFGSYKRRPGAFCGGSPWDEVSEKVKQEGYDERCRKAAVILPWVLLICCAAPMGLLLRGADTVKGAYAGVFDDIDSLTKWVDGKIDAIEGNMTVDGEYIDPINADYFYKARNASKDFSDSLFKQKSDNEGYVNDVKTYSIVVGCVPIVFFVLNAIFSLCHIRTCFPLINSFFMLLLTIVYGLLATVLLMVTLLVRDTCDEVAIYNEGRKPGILSWYVLPLCDDVAPFKSIGETIDQAEKDNAKEACVQLDEVCDHQQTYTAADALAESKVVFYCPDLSDPNDCVSFKNLTDLLNTTILKTVDPPTLGQLCNVSNCSVYDCVHNCTNEDARNQSAQTVKYIDFANRALDAFNNNVRPVLDCKTILDAAIGSFESCNDIKESTWYPGVGCLLFECFCVASLVIIWVGQKRWFNTADKDKEMTSKNEPTKY